MGRGRGIGEKAAEREGGREGGKEGERGRPFLLSPTFPSLEHGDDLRPWLGYREREEGKRKIEGGVEVGEEGSGREGSAR